MKSMKFFAILLALSAASICRAGGVEVFLNGVQITGVRDQVIEKAKVVLDSNGNVHIEAPDYKVREVSDGGTPAEATEASTLQKQYFVVTEVSRTNATGYQVQLIVNNKFIKTISEVPQYVVELHKYLKPGENSVSFRAIRPKGKKGSGSAEDHFNLIIGEGRTGAGGELVIDEVLGEFKLLGSDQGEKARTFTFTAR